MPRGSIPGSHLDVGRVWVRKPASPNASGTPSRVDIEFALESFRVAGPAAEPILGYSGKPLSTVVQLPKQILFNVDTIYLARFVADHGSPDTPQEISDAS